YFTLFDDGMISMRYARNFAEGYGLVWNPGGPAVEGYTNPLWVVLMAFWHLFPISASKMSLVIQLNALALLALNLVFVRRLALAISNSNAVALIAVILTATYLPLNNWSLQGMEVAALAPLVSCAAWLAVKGIQSGKPSPLAYLLLGVGILIRMDVAVLLAALTLFLFIVDKQNRLQHLAYGFGALALFGGAQTVFRLAYYGYLFPNTYYLKLDGFPLISRMLRGAYVFGWFIASMSLVVFLATFVIVALRRNAYVLLLAFLFAAQSVYSIYVGGDAWEWWGGSNRYISIVMPLFMVLLAYSLHYVITHERWRALVDTAPAVAYLHLVILVGLLLWAAIVNYSGFSVGLPEWVIAIAAWATIAYALNRRMPLKASTSSPKSVSPLRIYALPVILFLAIIDLNSLYVPSGILELFLVKTPVQVHNNPEMVERALLLRQTLKPGATYAVTWAGIIPYFAGGDAIDLLGKNDPVIAHQPMHANATASRPDFYFYPGHMKYDYAHSIGELKPDAIVQFWSLEAEPPDQPPGPIPYIARPFVEGIYTPTIFGDLDTPFYFRDDSSRIRWDAVQQLAKPAAGQTTP
ncbi:MAG: glycosyltransferase family 39 protein, partial [Chloroflexia bacterium]